MGVCKYTREGPDSDVCQLPEQKRQLYSRTSVGGGGDSLTSHSHLLSSSLRPLTISCLPSPPTPPDCSGSSQIPPFSTDPSNVQCMSARGALTAPYISPALTMFSQQAGADVGVFGLFFRSDVQRNRKSR